MEEISLGGKKLSAEIEERMAPFFALDEKKRQEWKPKTRVSKKGFLKQRLEEFFAEDQDWSVEKKIQIASELNMTL